MATVEEVIGALPTGQRGRPSNAASMALLRRPGLFRLLLKNAVLGALTLGLYRFWARTNLRRYFWSAVTLDGEPFEYTGRGRELFLGFLVVMAVFVPLTLLYVGLQATQLANETTSGILDIAYFSFLVPLIVAAGFRARRYRLSRTLWRGIRAGQDGSTWAYLGRYLLWLFAFPLTLGWCAPWWSTDLARYRMRHTLWGDLRGRFEGRAKDLLPSYALAWTLAFGPWLIILAVALSNGIDLSRLLTGADSLDRVMQELKTRVPVLMTSLLVIGYLLPALGSIIFQVHWFRWYLSGMRFGDAAIQADFKWTGILGQILLGWLCIGGLLLGAGLAAGFVAGIGSVTFGDKGTAVLAAAGVVLALGVWFVLRVSYFYLLHVPILRRLTAGTYVVGLSGLMAGQRAIGRDQTGEGLADSFDIGMG